MAFTASHYLEVAAIIRAAQERYMNAPVIAEIQRDLGAMFLRQNPRFDLNRFNKDCEPKP